MRENKNIHQWGCSLESFKITDCHYKSKSYWCWRLILTFISNLDEKILFYLHLNFILIGIPFFFLSGWYHCISETFSPEIFFEDKNAGDPQHHRNSISYIIFIIKINLLYKIEKMNNFSCTLTETLDCTICVVSFLYNG